MKPKRLSVTVSVGEIRWAAGLMEGEGWFGLKNRNKTPAITVGMTDCDVIVHLNDVFPGRLTEQYRVKWKTVYYWNVVGSKAVQVMMTVYTLMGERRRSAIESALAVWRTTRCMMPKGMGLRNPASPYYHSANAHWADVFGVS